MLSQSFFKNIGLLNFGQQPKIEITAKKPEAPQPTANTGKEVVIDLPRELPSHAVVSALRVSEPRTPERLNANPDMQFVKLPLSKGGYLLPPNPTRDGIDHINVNIDAETEIGKMLSHFFYSPFIHPMYGRFANLEAFWQWIKSVERPEVIRTMSAPNAKKEGRHLEKRKVPQFYEVIADANYLRITQNHTIYEALMNSTLPFDTYYLNASGMATRPQDSVKMIKQFEQIRHWLRHDIAPPELDYKHILYSNAD